MPSPSTYHAILTRALSEELGIVVLTNNPQYLASELYKYRSANADPAMNEIAIIKPGTGDRLLLAKKSVELEP